MFTHLKTHPKVLSNHLFNGKVILSSLFLSCLFISSPSDAYQLKELERLTNTNSIIEDKFGYIWLTGQHGLMRYDGQKINNLSDTFHSSSVPFIWTHDIEENGDNLVVSTETRGVWLVNSYSGESTQLPININNYSAYFTTFFNGQYYIYTSTPDNIYRYDPSTLKTSLIKSRFSITGLVKTSKGVFAYSNHGLYQIFKDKVQLIKPGKIDAATSSENEIFFSIDRKLFSYKDSKEHTAVNIKSPLISITLGNAKESLFAIDNKNVITRFDRKLMPIKHNFNATFNAQTYKLYHDKSNALWAITSQGTFIITEANHTNYDKTFDVMFNSIEVASYNDEIIIGSYGAGIHTLKSSQLFPDNINDQLVGSAKIVTDIEVVNHYLYIATFNGLWRYDFLNKKIIQIALDLQDKILLKISYHNNLLYLSSDSEGAIIFNPKTMRVSQKIDDTFSLNSFEVIDTLPIGNSIWMATSSGISILNLTTNEVENLDLKGSSKVISLVYSEKKIFAFTNGDGVFVYNQNRELLSHFANNVRFSYSKLINGIIWAPSRTGLYQIKPENNQVTIVSGTENYAFTGEPINVNNKIYIGHYAGIIELPVELQSTYNSPVYISNTNVSGKEYLNAMKIDSNSSNDVISFNISSLDYRSGLPKKYKYKINNGTWHNLPNNTLTLTGLSSGTYNVEMKGTNSLGQWSSTNALTTIEVAYPWYWTLQLRIIYAVTAICAILYGLWLLFLRTTSISKVHQLLEGELQSKGKRALSISRSLRLSLNLLEKGNTPNAIQVIEQSIETLEQINKQKEPDNLYGNSLAVAIPFLSEHLNNKYHIKLNTSIEIDESKLSYELLSDIYKITYESITSSLLNSESKSYEVNLQEFKSKLWLTISDDEDSFAHFNSAITFNMAMYYVRKIAQKYNASVNTFDAIDDKGSQLVISFPLMTLS